MLPLEPPPSSRDEVHTARVLTERPQQEPHLAGEPEEVEPDEEVLGASAEGTDPHDGRPLEGWGAGADASRPGASGGEDWRSYDAGAIAAITPAVPRAAAIPSQTSRAEIPASWSAMPARQAPWSAPPARPASQSAPFGYAAPAPSPSAFRDSSRRTSVAPVVMASLPPVTAAPRVPVTRRPLSADSKLLAAGGALAAAMLLVAVGVLLGQRSTATSPTAATPGAYPVVIEAKAPTAAALPPAATAALPVEARPAPGPVVERADGPTTVDVQQLPSAPRPRPQGWSVVAAPRSTGSAGGWTVAGSLAARSAPAAIDPTPRAASAPTAAAAPTATDAPEPIASAAAVASEPPAAAATPPVDPLVQAVREDIREDEARSK
jgi:hypothetical protein